MLTHCVAACVVRRPARTLEGGAALRSAWDWENHAGQGGGHRVPHHLLQRAGKAKVVST